MTHTIENCRIAITGIGLCTPLGADRETSWRGLVAGQSAVRRLDAPWWTEESPLAGAPVRFSSQRSHRHPEPLVELALQTAAESLLDASLDRETLKQTNVGVVFGTSKGGLHTFSRLMHESRSNCQIDSVNTCRLSKPEDWLDVFPNQAAMSIQKLIGGYGPVICPVAACATGLAACLRGADLIRNGDCDVVLAGSADVSLQPALLGSFRRLGVLSRETKDAASACRPFDLRRSGFVIGEGAACLVLERLEAAQDRKATCYAEWIGGRVLSDPHGLTQLDPQGTSLQRLLRDLRSIRPKLPDYVNLHGTATHTNDLVECRAMRAVFGDDADAFDCSSLKGGIGHLLGAAGSVELAATVLAIRDQIVPPTVNLSHQDPECRLKLTPQVAIARRIDHAWKLSMGFGGHIAGACLAALPKSD